MRTRTCILLAFLLICLVWVILPVHAQDGGTTVETNATLGKGVMAYTSQVWTLTNPYGGQAKVTVEYQKCNDLAEIEKLEVYGNNILFVTIQDGAVTQSSGQTTLQPGQTLVFDVWGQAYSTTTITQTTITLRVTVEEVEAIQGAVEKKETVSSEPTLILLVVLGVALVLGMAVGAKAKS